MLLLTAVLAASGLILSGIGAAMWAGRMPPNPVVGFRTPRTLADPAVWYGANRIAGRDLVLMGGFMAVLALAIAGAAPPGVPIEDVDIWVLLLPLLPVLLFMPLTFFRVSAWVADHDAEPDEPPQPEAEETAERASEAVRRPAPRVEER